MGTKEETANFTNSTGAKDKLSQIYGTLEKLRNKEIDAVATGDLVTGKDQVQKLRKQLTTRIKNLLDTVKNLVDKINKKEQEQQIPDDKPGKIKKKPFVLQRIRRRPRKKKMDLSNLNGRIRDLEIDNNGQSSTVYAKPLIS